MNDVFTILLLSWLQKALLECDTEWTENKKVIDLSQKDVRRAVRVFILEVLKMCWHWKRISDSYK